MRLHRLEITAFGPYAGTEVVDLDRLGADGLFLLHGETGSGKTSVLDAISFALFGRVPGARQQAGRLRCDLAGPDRAPQVRLELTLAGRRLRVTRAPEWYRPKRRGDGLTRQPATAVLEEYDGATWSGRSTRIDEVSQQLQDWLGMSAEQFFQVVLLPQGDFARFLRAESAEREVLLEKLFGAQRFTDVQDWLAERRRSALIVVEKTESELRSWLHRLCQAAGIPAGGEPDLAATDEAWRADLDAGALLAVDQAASRAESASAERTRAVRAAEDARESSRLQARRVHAERDSAAIAAERPRHEARYQALAAARRAGQVQPLIAELTLAQQSVEVVSAATNACLDRLDEIADEPVDRTDAPALKAWQRRLSAESDRLERLGADAERHRALLDEQQAADGLRSTLEAGVAPARARLAVLPVLLAEAQDTLTRAERAAATLTGLRAAAQALRTAQQAARQADETAGRVAELSDQLRAVTDSHQQAVEAMQDARARRLDGMAAELAGSLVDGCPCPVCGSDRHPAVATERTDPVSAADEEQAAARETAARAERVTVEAALQVARTEHVRLLERSGGRAPAALAHDLAAATAETEAAQAAADGLPDLRSELATLGAEQTGFSALLRDAEIELAELGARIAGTAEQAGAIAERLDAARGEDPSIQARRHRLDKVAQEVAALIDALAQTRTAAAARGRAEAAATAQATRAGFTGLDQASTAFLGDEAIDALEQQTAAYERSAAQCAQLLAEPGLSDPDVIALAAAPSVDLSVTDGARLAAEHADTAAATALAVANQTLAEVRRLTGEFTAADAAAVPARVAYAEVKALADLVAGSGQNTRNMTLRAYVLAARLADVAASASTRLHRMSGGRFSLQQTDAADSKRLRAGLGLEILDDYSGRTRSTKTLSGGECFMASLALALGLADVVTAESGGIELETLFIDEGFGSLDADTLDLVMDTLDELRAGGRVVGVVSHVEEMRSRIPSRLHVRKHRDGSSLEQRSA